MPLDARQLRSEGRGNCSCQDGLSDAGHIFDEKVATREGGNRRRSRGGTGIEQDLSEIRHEGLSECHRSLEVGLGGERGFGATVPLDPRGLDGKIHGPSLHSCSWLGAPGARGTAWVVEAFEAAGFWITTVGDPDHPRDYAISTLAQLPVNLQVAKAKCRVCAGEDGRGAAGSRWQAAVS